MPPAPVPLCLVVQVEVVRSKSWRSLEQGTGESKTPKPDDADKSKKGPRVPFNFMTAGMPCCGEHKRPAAPRGSLSGA